MAQIRTIPRGPFVDQRGELTRTARTFLQLLIPKAATQSDGGNAAGDPPTQAEFNALVAVVNALIDKLQAAGQME